MKKYFNFTLLTFAILLFTGCSSEEEIAGENPAGSGDNITFVFPGMVKGSTTYAIATDPENKIESIDAYAFDAADGTFVAEFADQSYTQSGTSYVLTLTDASLKGKSLNFYFVANANKAHGAAVNGGAVLSAAGITETDFANTLTDALTDVSGKSKAIVPSLLFSGKTATAVTLGASSTTVQMKRRVARFDIVNNIGATFTVNKVLVSDAKTQGLVFANATTAITTIANKSVEEIVISSSAAEVPHAFYLYATSTPSPTKILVNATYAGDTKDYEVSTTMNIGANKRYKLVISQDLKFTLVVEDWDEGTELPTESRSELSLAAITGLNVANQYELTNAVGQFTFTTYALSAAGVDVTVADVLGTFNATVDNVKITKGTVGALTYANAGYPQTITVDLKAYAGSTDVLVNLRVKDKSNPNATLIIPIYYTPTTSEYYPGTALEPVVVGGVTWAPVNVGATTTDATILNVTSMGYLYQWGRSYASLTGLSGDELAGPVSLVNATTGTHKDKFITSTGDWLSTPDNTLWSGANNQAVCPAGWRLPTSSDCGTIQGRFSSVKFDASKHRLAISGDVAGQTVYLPAAGYRNNTGASAGLGTYGYYWTSSLNGANANYLNFHASGSVVGSYHRSDGFSIRCVKAN